MKKSLIAGAAVIVLAGGIAVSGIHAYYSDADTVVNTFPLGTNVIEVREEFDVDTGVKTPRAVNTGDTDLYVRARITASDSRALEDGSLWFGTEIGEGYDQRCWEEAEDGWLYYCRSLSPGEETEPVITKVRAGDTENYPDLTLDVIFESVQSEGFSSATAAFDSLSA